MLQIDNLTFQYNSDGKLFNFPNINLEEGENLLFLGKSGIGKTTLLHLLSGLLKPVSGKVQINGKNIHSISASALDKFIGKNIGLVFQQKHAIQSLNVLENLQTRLFLSGNPINNKAIDDLLAQLDILDCKNNKLTTLSEGQLQRLGIAMAVVHNPKVILADEPTSSLDDENSRIVIELLINQAKRNNANLLVITHDQRIKSLFSNTITL